MQNDEQPNSAPPNEQPGSNPGPPPQQPQSQNVNQQQPQGNFQPTVNQQPTSFPAPPPQKKPGKGKLIAVIVGVFVLLAGLGATAFFYLQSDDTAEVSSNAVSQSDGFESAPRNEGEPQIFSELDQEFMQYRVESAQDAQVPEYYKNTLFFYNDEGNFALTDTEYSRLYQLDFHDGEAFAQSNYDCGPLQEQYGADISRLRAIFSDAGFQISDVSPVQQYENCQDAFIAVNEVESCSAGFYIGPDVTRQTENAMGGPGEAVHLTASCKQLTSLENEIADTRALHTAITATDSSNVTPNEQLVGKAVVLEASNSEHTIIEHQRVGPNYYYSYEDQWYHASFTDFIPCNFTGSNADQEREVFLGQECVNQETRTPGVVQ